MTKKMIALVIGFITLATASVSLADTPGNMIAIVNIQQIMRDSTAAQNVREQLESKQKTFQSELSKKEEDLQKEDQELSKKRSVLSKAAFDEKANKFRAKATDLQKEVQAKKAILDGSFERSIGEIQKSVTDIIGDMAKEKGFTIAIPTSQILYGDTKYDITTEVLNRLNQKLPKLEVKFEAPAAASAIPAAPAGAR